MASFTEKVLTDSENERGEHPVGQVVHLSTVTHAWRGKLLEVTPSYYILDPAAKVALVDSTGKISDYMESPTAGSEGDDYTPGTKKPAPTVRVLRGAVSWMLSWPVSP